MRFKMFSLGCKVNSYECSALASLLINRGYIEDNDNPDVIIINTCSVTATADQKSRQHIRKFIKTYPNAITVVMGCYAQGNAEYIANEIKPTILVGTSNRNKIPELIDEYLKTKQNIVLVDADTRHFKYEEICVTSFSENVRAYLKIQDGCNNFCSYCLIPYRRGCMRSREAKDIIEEAHYLVKQNYNEIVLSGIHVGGYGQDLGNMSFSDLVEQLSNINGLSRLRISSIEESEIDDKLINLIKNKDNLAKHLHIPLQSGSDTVLVRMNRKYNCEQFLNKLIKIKEEIPDVALSTDVIVGFPGETEEEFNETYNFIKQCGFNMLHVFPFSAREGTVAFNMKNQIDPQIKALRAQSLIHLSNQLWDEYTDKYVGKTLSILIEKINNGVCYGHSSNYINIKFKNNNHKIGQFIDVKIQKDMIESR